MTLERDCISRIKSVNDAVELIVQKYLIDEVGELCAEWQESDDEIIAVLDEHDWETEYAVPIGDTRPRFDGFKQRVGLEHETRSQMHIRSHLLWIEAGYQTDAFDAGVLVVPANNDASVKRADQELHDEIFTEHFPIECPLLLVEYYPE